MKKVIKDFVEVLFYAFLPVGLSVAIFNIFGNSEKTVVVSFLIIFFGLVMAKIKIAKNVQNK